MGNVWGYVVEEWEGGRDVGVCEGVGEGVNGVAVGFDKGW